MMFTRFTRGAREVVVHAQAEARALGHRSVGTGHLLLGVAATSPLLAEHGATPEALREALAEPAGDALAAIGIDLGEVRRRVEAAFGPGALERPRRGRVPFSPAAKQALERSLQEALARRDNHIGPEHVLLALLDDGDAAAALRRAGAPPEEIRAASRRGRAA